MRGWEEGCSGGGCGGCGVTYSMEPGDSRRGADRRRRDVDDDGDETC